MKWPLLHKKVMAANIVSVFTQMENEAWVRKDKMVKKFRGCIHNTPFPS
jgi:hypothetical protein